MAPPVPSPAPAKIGMGQMLLSVLMALARLAIIIFGCVTAYEIRMYAIREYGPLIHEFDPWFNYRATEHLHKVGRAKFFTWFDHMSWYPLGRPVGTTIYPGMQFTAVGIFHVLKWIGKRMSLNDVCCYVPAWFGVSASLLTGLLAFECTNSWSALSFSTLVMAIMPAHLLRSIGGGYDNESIAVTAMCLTFWLWCRCLRHDSSWPISVAAGIAYSYMVAAWGGYVFVINMVAAHAGLLLAMGRYDQKLYKCYSIFYAVGTLLAMQIPVVGWTPLKSLEQIAPLGLFIAFQILQLSEMTVIKKDLGGVRRYLARVVVFLVAAMIVAAGVYVLMPTDVLTPVSLRVRSLFIKHTRTGNPLVDSVAEHKATSPDAYWTFLHLGCYVAPVGWLLTWIFGRKGDAKFFLILYAAIAMYFANKMSRLVILLGPVASALCGVALGLFFDWAISVFVRAFGGIAAKASRTKPPPPTVTAAPEPPPVDGDKKKGPGVPVPPTPAPVAVDKKDKKAKQVELEGQRRTIQGRMYRLGAQAAEGACQVYDLLFVRLACTVLVAYLLSMAPPHALEFWKWSDQMAHSLSANPHVVFKARLNDGQVVIVKDYLEGYEWLKKRTPKDSRILAWWDYGYQITGIANRTSLADGNTWNQAHIAFIGKMLTSPEPKAHKLIRHMADYVLVWAGGGGDDLAKSPHLARIATSNFPKHCGSDKTCEKFGFNGGYQQPTPMMAKSLLYKMVANHVFPGVTLNTSLWEEVFKSKYGKIRIYKVKGVDKESKKWVAGNKVCDRPGSWYCPGQYPPAVWPYLPPHFLKGHNLNETDAQMDEGGGKEEL